MLDKTILAEDGFDPSACGLWAHHASTAPLCYIYILNFRNICYINNHFNKFILLLYSNCETKKKENTWTWIIEISIVPPINKVHVSNSWEPQKLPAFQFQLVASVLFPLSHIAPPTSAQAISTTALHFLPSHLWHLALLSSSLPTNISFISSSKKSLIRSKSSEGVV